MGVQTSPVVIVRISGGVVQDIETPAGVKVIVYDYDGEGPSDFKDKDDGGEPCNMAVFEQK